MTTPRLALIHAVPIVIEPVASAFRELWPQARVAAGIAARSGHRVLTSPRSAVARLKLMLAS